MKKSTETEQNQFRSNVEEKVIPMHRVEEKIAENEDIELKDNWSHIYFECHATFENCVYFTKEQKIKGDYEYSTCKYYANCRCNSAVAQTNAMVMKLKSLGFKYVKLEG